MDLTFVMSKSGLVFQSFENLHRETRRMSLPAPGVPPPTTSSLNGVGSSSSSNRVAMATLDLTSEQIGQLIQVKRRKRGSEGKAKD